jgi:hypothetical protein
MYLVRNPMLLASFVLYICANTNLTAAIISLPTASVLNIEHQSLLDTTFQVHSNISITSLAVQGTASLGDFSGSWQPGDTIRIRVEAKVGHVIKATPYPGIQTSFLTQLGYLDGGGPTIESPPVITFDNLSGSIPDTYDLDGFVGEFSNILGYSFGFILHESISFTAFEIEFIANGGGVLSPDSQLDPYFFIEIAAAGPMPLPRHLLLELLPIPEPNSLSTIVGMATVFGVARRRSFGGFFT